MKDKVFRSFNRKATRQRAQFKNKRGVSLVVLMMDVSPTGCLVEIKYRGLHSGEHVTLRPVTFESIQGVVRWTSGDRAGIQFATPLHTSAVDHLVKTAIDPDADADGHQKKNFGIAQSLGKRLLPGPAISVMRSVA